MSNNKQIPVLQTIRQGIIGGGESHVISLVENLDRSQFKPVVLSFTDGPMVETLKKMNVSTHVIPTTKPFDFRVWNKVRALLEEEKIRMVHAHGTRAASNVYKACVQTKTPLAYTIHGWSFHDDQSSLVKKLRIVSESFITKRTTVNVSVSESNRQAGIKNIKGFSSILIRYGIDLNKFNQHKEYGDLRQKLGISSSATLVGFVARMTYQKNPIKMVEAFAKAASASSDIHMLMVGDGELKKDALEKAEELKVTDRITFTPFSQDVPSVLNAIDVYCLPSYWEGLPIGLLEAMAMGKAVIASKVDGTVEVIEHRTNGMLIDPHNIDELAKAILELHADTQLLNKLESNARRTVEDIYVDKRMTREIEQMYLNCLSPTFSKQKAYEL